MTLQRLLSLTLAVLAITSIVAAQGHQGQQGHWAAADDATAKFIIDAEREWGTRLPD